MRILSPYLLGLTLVASAAAAQLPERWIPYRQVTWNDFKGRASPLGPEAAAIATGVYVEPFEVEVRHLEGESWLARPREPEIHAYMDPAGSGVRPGAHSDYALAHEQLHFDLSEVYARRLRAAVPELEARGDDPVRVRFQLLGRLQELRASHLAELSEMQKRYDRETGHGTRRGKQKDWRRKIAGLLQDTVP